MSEERKGTAAAAGTGKDFAAADGTFEMGFGSMCMYTMEIRNEGAIINGIIQLGAHPGKPKLLGPLFEVETQKEKHMSFLLAHARHEGREEVPEGTALGRVSVLPLQGREGPAARTTQGRQESQNHP